MAKIKGRLVAESYLNESRRLNAGAFDEVLYIGDGDSKGFRFMK